MRGIISKRYLSPTALAWDAEASTGCRGVGKVGAGRASQARVNGGFSRLRVVATGGASDVSTVDAVVPSATWAADAVFSELAILLLWGGAEK